MTNVPSKVPEASAFNPWLIWIAFRRHWGWVVPCGSLLATLAALAVWSTFVPEYEATHIMEANNDFVISKGLDIRSQDLARSERNLITHVLVLEPVLQDPELQAAPSLADALTKERNIRRLLSVGNAGTDNLLTITYRDTDAKMAAAVCNAIAESYMEVRQRFDDERYGNVERWLQQPIEIWKRNVEDKQKTLSEMVVKANGYDPFKENSRFESDASRASELHDQLDSLEFEEIELQARLNAVQERHENTELSNAAYEPDPVMIANFVTSDPEVASVRQKLAAIQGRIQSIELKEQQGMLASRYESLKADTKATQEELVPLEAAARERGVAFLWSKQAKEATIARAREIEELNFRVSSLKAKKSILAQEYEKERTRLDEMGGETVAIQFARDDWQRANEMLSRLKERLESLRAERGRGSSFHTMAAAQIPSWPMEEVPFKKILMAGGGAFLFPFALAILLEFRIKRLTNANNIEAHNLAPLMGEIARIPAGAKSSRGQRLFEESVDALRANMLFKLEGVRTIVVTSAMPSEGKSSVASQLAISLAKASECSVLLIDADLRSPDQHELFGLENGPGLCKFLAGKATLAECIDKSLGDLVHVLPAGRLDSNPHNLLTKKNIERLFTEVKQQYQYIVVDTAPILPAAESLAVTAAGDATLLCAMRDVSRSDHVKRSQRRLEAAGANILGTVFSGVPSSEYAYRYGDYRYTKDRAPSLN